MKFIFTIFVGLILSFKGEVSAAEVFYSNISDITKKQMIFDGGRIFGHPALQGGLCATEKEFVCIESEIFNFAFPRAASTPANWEHNGYKYVVTRQVTKALLGDPLLLFQIDQIKDATTQMRFLYSKKSGVISFQSKVGAGGWVFLLEGQCGILSLSQCAER